MRCYGSVRPNLTCLQEAEEKDLPKESISLLRTLVREDGPTGLGPCKAA